MTGPSASKGPTATAAPRSQPPLSVSLTTSVRPDAGHEADARAEQQQAEQHWPLY